MTMTEFTLKWVFIVLLPSLLFLAAIPAVKEPKWLHQKQEPIPSPWDRNYDALQEIEEYYEGGEVNG